MAASPFYSLVTGSTIVVQLKYGGQQFGLVSFASKNVDAPISLALKKLGKSALIQLNDVFGLPEFQPGQSFAAELEDLTTHEIYDQEVVCTEENFAAAFAATTSSLGEPASAAGAESSSKGRNNNEQDGDEKSSDDAEDIEDDEEGPTAEQRAKMQARLTKKKNIHAMAEALNGIFVMARASGMTARDLHACYVKAGGPVATEADLEDGEEEEDDDDEGHHGGGGGGQPGCKQQ
jgi:hypothetical protein